jgi:hypothetical protein
MEIYMVIVCSGRMPYGVAGSRCGTAHCTYGLLGGVALSALIGGDSFPVQVDGGS